jgi:hypothetical protein
MPDLWAVTDTVQMLKLEMPWTTPGVFNTLVSNATMARNRFKLTLKCLHFSNEEDRNTEDNSL